MKVILSFVISLDGYVTDSKGRPPPVWASREDQKHFSKLIKECGVVVMGGKTYEAQKKKLRLSQGVLRMIVTRHPARRRKESVPGQLEFTSLRPKALLHSLQKRGYKKVLLAAGPALARLFIKAGLVDELRLTVEPILFGEGIKMDLGSAQTRLLTIHRLNSNGTLLLTYRLAPFRRRRDLF
jgi:dihydrofolate reductase